MLRKIPHVVGVATQKPVQHQGLVFVCVSEEEKEREKLSRWPGVECSMGKDSSHPGRVFYVMHLRSTQQRRQGPSLGDRQTERASSRQWSWKVDGTQSQTLAIAGIVSKSVVPMLIGPKNLTIL